MNKFVRIMNKFVRKGLRVYTVSIMTVESFGDNLHALCRTKLRLCCMKPCLIFDDLIIILAVIGLAFAFQGKESKRPSSYFIMIIFF